MKPNKTATMEHVQLRMKQRLRRDISETDYSAMCDTTEARYVERRMRDHGLSERIIRFQGRTVIALYHAWSGLVLTCWGANQKDCLNYRTTYPRGGAV
jgi:hypothetical protein